MTELGQIKYIFGKNAIEQWVTCLNSWICGDFAISRKKKRFDVDLTDKMTELDQTKHSLGIFSKNPIEQGVTCVVVYIFYGLCYEMVYIGSKNLDCHQFNLLFFNFLVYFIVLSTPKSLF